MTEQLEALLKLAVRLLQDHHIKDGYNKKWCPVCTDVVTGESNLARLEAALNAPAAAVCSAARMACQRTKHGDCFTHRLPQGSVGKFEAAGGKNA